MIRSTVWWRRLQVAALVATGVLIAMLLAMPRPGLRILWDIAIPLLPAVFLINPGLWRNVCPLATLNLLPNRWGARRVLEGQGVQTAGTIGVLLLAVMVPARHFLFNQDGVSLAATVIAVALLAMVLGLVFDKKAGFCSGICPVLPVERLYGQSPLLLVGNPRCLPCTMCTSPGCLDVAHTKSIAQTLGRQRQSHGWLSTSFGAFAAGFPGFVLGYFLAQDGPLASAGRVYSFVALATAASYLVWQLIVRGFNLRASTAIRLSATIAIVLYYWFIAATVSEHLSLPQWSSVAIRTAAFVVIGFWLWRASRSAGQRRLRPHGTASIR